MEIFSEFAQMSGIILILIVVTPILLTWLFLYTVIKAGVKNGILAAHDCLHETIIVEEEVEEENW